LRLSASSLLDLPGSKARLASSELLVSPRAVQWTIDIAELVHDHAQFVIDETGDGLSHRQPDRLAVAPPGRPRGIRQRDLDHLTHRDGSELGENLPVDLRQDTSIERHQATSPVNQSTGRNVLHVRVVVT